jgi:hypothetical protein
MDKNVFLSLLAMDSYNRVYNRRLKISDREGGAIIVAHYALR